MVGGNGALMVAAMGSVGKTVAVGCVSERVLVGCTVAVGCMRLRVA
jgi:hypothetical protein